jgi:hypothetical protein
MWLDAYTAKFYDNYKETVISGGVLRRIWKPKNEETG